MLMSPIHVVGTRSPDATGIYLVCGRRESAMSLDATLICFGLLLVGVFYEISLQTSSAPKAEVKT
jgi:hypothetical protein